MKNRPMTKETESKLIESTELAIEFVAKSVGEVRSFIKKVKLMTGFMEEHNISSEDEMFDSLEKLLEYRMLIGLIFLDLGSATRAHLNSKYTYEKLFFLRQIIVIINEGYKQIYNFVKLNDNGDSVTKYRNKSFWYKDIRTIINTSLPELSTEYNSLTQKLEDYFKENFSSIKEQRDLSVHYDKKASKVYDMFVSLEIEETFKKLSPFLDILTGMFRFTEKMASISQIKERQKNIEMHNRMESMFLDLKNKIINSKTDKNIEGLNKLKELIDKTKRDFFSKLKSPNT